MQIITNEQLGTMSRNISDFEIKIEEHAYKVFLGGQVMIFPRLMNKHEFLEEVLYAWAVIKDDIEAHIKETCVSFLTRLEKDAIQ